MEALFFVFFLFLRFVNWYKYFLCLVRHEYERVEENPPLGLKRPPKRLSIRRPRRRRSRQSICTPPHQHHRHIDHKPCNSPPHVRYEPRKSRWCSTSLGTAHHMLHTNCATWHQHFRHLRHRSIPPPAYMYVPLGTRVPGRFDPPPLIPDDA